MSDEKSVDWEGRIEQRLAVLRAQREQVLAQANRQLAAIDGAIAALEELQKGPEPEPPPEE